MEFFQKVPLAPPDSVFGVARAFSLDSRSSKVNLGVGSYRTAALEPLILHTVKEAEKKILVKEKNKEYLPIEGEAHYLELSHTLLFGSSSTEFVAAVQSVGGTNALRLATQFLANSGLRKILLPLPAWGNHHHIFSHAHLEIVEIPYYNKKEHLFDEKGFLEALDRAEEGSIVLLQACCHNPTGCDPTLQQWQMILERIKERKLFPLFDIAYQGFGESMEEDVEAIRLFRKAGIEMAVAVSFSKNFGLYGERAGILFFIAHDNRQKEAILSQLKVLVRGDYSNPPCHGARIVSEILGNESLKLAWIHEVDAMRERISQMRRIFSNALEAHLPRKELSFAHIARGKGMFAFTGLRSDQVEQLISEYAIYMLKNGRVNLAGLNLEVLNYVVDAIVSVL